MRLLLDTHIWLWFTLEPEKCPRRALAAISDPASEVFLSSISALEIAIKSSLGKLPALVPLNYLAWSQQQGLRELPFSAAHALRIRQLPAHHRDPFDRALVAQAQVEGLVLATLDARLRAYDIEVLAG